MVEPGGVLRSVSFRPPLTVRRIAHDHRDVCALCLVGSAAGPLAGDEIAFDLVVADHARARLTWTGASLAQGRLDTGRAAQLITTATVGDHAELEAETSPVVVCNGSLVRVAVALDLAVTATVSWRETAVLGRYDEPGGSLTMSWRVDRGGIPLLRQEIELAPGWLRDWPGMLAGGRVLATAFVSGPRFDPATYVESATAVCQQLDPASALITVLDSDYASASKRMDALLANVCH